jgi:hypothetical protein
VKRKLVAVLGSLALILGLSATSASAAPNENACHGQLISGIANHNGLGQGDGGGKGANELARFLCSLGI